ncbi:MAG: ComEA family DNA-binding protein [Candidatus Omnitrophica bacterium]|nr:ComEA family DNA-binding protein [Candidatus Omnitrophota bacterium]
MFCLTHYERKAIIFLVLIIAVGAILRYTHLKYTHHNILKKNLVEYKNTTLININTAQEKDLEKIPHIGKKIAASIIQYRKNFGRFNNIEDLLKIKGIGRKKLELIKDYITF